MMLLKHGLLAVATAMAITGAATAGGCYEYGAIGFDTDGGHMFAVNGTVHNTIIGGTEDYVYFELDNFELWMDSATAPYDSVKYAQFRTDIMGDIVYGVDVHFQIDEMTSIDYRISFEYHDIFTLQTYSNVHGVGEYFVDDAEVGIYTQSSLTAVPGSGALPLAGLAGLAIGRRRRRSNK